VALCSPALHQIPSLVNLVIGGTSLVLRGLPGVPTLVPRYIPERGWRAQWDRHWIATVLTAQVAGGAALGIEAQVFLVWVIIGHVMPFFGPELPDRARHVAASNLPARVGQLFWGEPVVVAPLGVSRPRTRHFGERLTVSIALRAARVTGLRGSFRGLFIPKKYLLKVDNHR
jgi:hypothetical protein